MLSGQLAPITANFGSNSQIIKDENFHKDIIKYESEKQDIQKSDVLTTTTTCSTSTAKSATRLPSANQPDASKPYPSQSMLHPETGNKPTQQQPPKTICTGANKTTTNDTNGRSAALERAYVHDVYENCDEPTGPIRPRVAQFLAGLDPGSVVCDVGCGNGRYLTACNPYICTIGIDRCHRLSKVAKGKGGEVALCDNLELPFRDESFDAVLSLAVVHHFATTERRVEAIRELARILRIGGRVVITVWALEQRHRRFESQDVLIPWQPPKNRNINYSDEEDDDDFLPPYHAYTEDSTNSSRSAGDGDSSSLSSSSPGESCYSFVRRAIQKLAGNRKHPWFLESWNSKDTKNNSSLDYEDAKDLPIELRRLEDFDDFADPPLSAGLKSRSLGCILNPSPRQIVRSRSSVPSLGCQLGLGGEQKLQSSSAQLNVPHTSTGTEAVTASVTPPISTVGRRPKLIKQKQSLCDDDYQLSDNPFHMATSNNYSSNGSISNGIASKRLHETKTFLRKQSSLNEELMAGNRIREKERVRKRIQKQMSLNEAFLCRSVIGKRLQVIREGFTTKLKTSTGSLERVTKNGLVKIMQNFKVATPTPTNPATTTHSPIAKEQPTLLKQSSTTSATTHKTHCSTYQQGAAQPCTCEDQLSSKPRRHSRESGSDSSKDSSLQSDTSIESEDSFASVIFIPKPELAPAHQHQQQQQQIYQQNNSNSSSSNSSSSNGNSHCISNHCKNRIPSVPTSPLIMPCPPTPAHSPAAANSTVTSPPQTMAAVTAAMSLLSPPNNTQTNTSKPNGLIQGNSLSRNRFTFDEEHIIEQQKSEKPLKQQQPSKITRQLIKDLAPIPKFRKQQSLPKNCYPIIRRTSTGPLIPKLMSLELFNPLTDDLDSDSSEPSSPDSIDSVIALKPNGEDEVSKNKDCSKEMASNVGGTDIIVNNDKNDSLPYNSTATEASLNTSSTRAHAQQDCADFAEQLSSQLMKELDDSNRANCRTLDNIDDIDEFIDDPPLSGQSSLKRRNGELIALRDELRERRLMLANLSTQHSQQQSPTSSSTSSLSSQTRSFTIHEEDEEGEEEDEEEYGDPLSSSSYSLNLYDNCKISKFKYKRNRHYNLNPETAYLLQDDGDSSIRDEDDEDICDDVILEEDEEEDNDNENNEEYCRKTTRNTIKCNSGGDSLESPAAACADADDGAEQQAQATTATGATAGTWNHSNSSTSLDSPSQGGATTHHRYYHVFREGELDALINHHVSSLHIVSSYYERASWCVVAEKVQVWTI